MPNIYSKISLHAQITLGDDDDFVFSQWTDNDLMLSRLEYGRPEFSVVFRINNPEEEISPGLISINNTDVYDGTFDVKKDGRTFLFNIEAKCKSNIHKGSKEIMEKGNKPTIDYVCINGQSRSLDDQNIKVEVTFSAKKI
jgi:hypothetical protein